MFQKHTQYFDFNRLILWADTLNRDFDRSQRLNNNINIVWEPIQILINRLCIAAMDAKKVVRCIIFCIVFSPANRWV